MKIVTWNCNGGFRKKFEYIDALLADILVIQECENPKETKHLAYKSWAQNYIWVGKNKNKGLGVFFRHDVTLEVHKMDDADLYYFINITINQSFNLLAVWTRNADEYSYIGQLWQYLKRNPLATQNTIIIGDWNSNKIWDYKRKAGDHSSVVKLLQDKGML